MADEYSGDHGSSVVNGMFVDPRMSPNPRDPRPKARLAAHADELEGLYEICNGGRLYDVERWIQAGKPLQLEPGSPLKRRRHQTALAIALERQDYALALLLVSNGYDLTCEPESPLDVALRLRRKDLLDLLLAWGANPLGVSVEVVCETYDTQLFEHFRSLGVNFTNNHELACALGFHTSNRPLYGFAKRHRLEDPRVQRDLDIALAHHTSEGNEKGTLLCLWAGANPHARVPSLHWGRRGDEEEEDDGQSAIYHACSNGHAALLERLKPDPALDDFDELYRHAANESVVDILARSALPKDPSNAISSQLSRCWWPFRDQRPLEVLQAFFKLGLRWQTCTNSDMAYLRRDLLKIEGYRFAAIVKLLATDDYCSPEVLTELARTPKMRSRMKEAGLIPTEWHERTDLDRKSPRGTRERLARFGIHIPPPERHERPVVRQSGPTLIGRARGHPLRLARVELYERVWSTPIDKLAKEWGLSGRGLAKACHRLNIPVPPRGYWAKVSAGQRVPRAKLPPLPGSHEVVIGVSELADSD